MLKSRLVLLLITGLFLSLLNTTYSNSLVKQDDYIPKEYPISSSYFNLTGTYMETNIYDNGDVLVDESDKIIAAILIDDTLENHTWVHINATYPWCSGLGTAENPFMIKNVYVDGLYMANTYIHYSNIFIRHSRAHFIIQNCSLHRNGANERGSLFFYNVTNGNIMDNELTYNGNSIRLFESHNFTIKNNYFKNTHNYTVGLGAAIWCDGYGNGKGSCNNTIELNTIINHYDGIKAHHSENLNITKNYINNTLFGHYPDTGIYLHSTNYSFITYNIFGGDYADYLEEGASIITQDNCQGNNITEAFTVYGPSSSSKIQIEQASTWFNLVDSNHNFIYGNRIIKTGYNPDIHPTVSFNFIWFSLFLVLIIATLVITDKKVGRRY